MDMKPVPDWPDYAICENGDVWRITSQGSKRPLEEPRRLKPFSTDGRPRVVLHGGGKRREFLLNGLVCTVYHGPRPAGDIHAAHENGNCADNRPVNLTWKTRDENENDKIRHGTLRAGSRVQAAKLKEADIPEIIAMQGKISSRKLSKKYGVTETAIRHVWAGRTWVNELMKIEDRPIV